METTRRQLLEEGLAAKGGDYRKAAQQLGFNPHGIHRSLKRLKLTHLLRQFTGFKIAATGTRFRC
jgi:transcriptional regulator with GAF, ATPase, and Fis domain